MATIPDPDYQALGVEVARLRAAKGWSLDRLAAESGVSRKSVINVEHGSHVVRVPTLHLLAHSLGVPLSDLISTLCADHGTD